MTQRNFNVIHQLASLAALEGKEAVERWVIAQSVSKNCHCHCLFLVVSLYKLLVANLLSLLHLEVLLGQQPLMLKLRMWPLMLQKLPVFCWRFSFQKCNQYSVVVSYRISGNFPSFVLYLSIIIHDSFIGIRVLQESQGLFSILVSFYFSSIEFSFYAVIYASLSSS